MRAMDAVTRGTNASAVHRNSQDIDVLNGVVDKLCLVVFCCSWRVGSWEQGDEEVFKVINVERSGSRSKTAPAVARGSRILARRAAAGYFLEQGSVLHHQWTMACAVLKGAERKYRCTGLEMAPFQRCRISCSTSSPEARNATSTCPISLEARSLSRHTHTTCHCCPASMGQHPICKSRPLPLPCRLSPSMPLLLPPEPAATAPYRMKND